MKTKWKYDRHKIVWDIGTILRCLPTYESAELAERLIMLRDEVYATKENKTPVSEDEKECKHNWWLRPNKEESFCLLCGDFKPVERVSEGKTVEGEIEPIKKLGTIYASKDRATEMTINELIHKTDELVEAVNYLSSNAKTK